MMKLQDLLKTTAFEQVDGSIDIDIFDVTADSRKAGKGCLFFCLSGARADGHDFAQSAVKGGAVAVISERKLDLPENITVVYVKDTRKAMEDMVPSFFGYPSRKMRMIAVTGTNGKTTTTHIISHILRYAGHKTGVIGTIHALIGDKEIPAHNTTPDVIDLQRLLHQMVLESVEYACMEVSSHALVMGRVVGCEFDTAVFTNLTEDHLDFHKTMENYAKAKAMLFTMISSEGQTKKNKSAWINEDDEYAQVMKSAIQDKDICACHTYGMSKEELFAFNNVFTGKGSAFQVDFKGENYLVKTNLVGRFNIYNTLAAIGAALSEKVSMEIIIKALTDFKSVPGRFELIDEGQSFPVVVDYAHTPDGLEKILLTAKEITKGKIIITFGCGGDRDKLKRPIMGYIAGKYADTVIITSDNPRTENPEDIIEDITEGVKKAAKVKKELYYIVDADRHKAIEKAVSMAGENDMVLIAGKGHEDYQILKDRTIHFDDREEARKVLRG